MSGVSSAGLTTHGVAGGERWREPPGGDRHREVPRHDDADDADRLVERDVDPAGDGDLAARRAARAPGVVLEDVADVARLPAGVGDRVPGVRDLELRPAPRGARRRRAANRRSSRARSAGATARHGWQRASRDARSRRRPRRASRKLDGRRSSCLGRRVEDRRRRAHSRSKPRKRSQSVTVERNAASSTRAAWT